MPKPDPHIHVESDPEADSLYLRFGDKPISFSVEVTPDFILDIAEDNTVVGMDLQHLTAVLKERANAGSTSGVFVPTGGAVPLLQLVG